MRSVEILLTADVTGSFYRGLTCLSSMFFTNRDCVAGRPDEVFFAIGSPFASFGSISVLSDLSKLIIVGREVKNTTADKRKKYLIGFIPSNSTASCSKRDCSLLTVDMRHNVQSASLSNSLTRLH